MTELGERPGGPRALLADRDYLRLWLVGGFANAVRWLELLAAGVFAYDQTGSGLVVAAMTAARMLPMLLIGALAGAVADAVNRKTLLLAGQAATGLSASVVCVLAFADLLTLWHIAAAGGVSGIVWAGEMAVRRRMVSEVAGPTRVAPAISGRSQSRLRTCAMRPSGNWTTPAEHPGLRAGAPRWDSSYRHCSMSRRSTGKSRPSAQARISGRWRPPVQR